MKNTTTISEIYGPVIQGEGSLMGLPTVFVRTGGCDMSCGWCDSKHAVDREKFGDQWEEWTTAQVLDAIIDTSKGYGMLVTLSGGNPAMQPFGELIEQGHAMEYSFALETQGTIARDWFAHLDHLVLSPKGPSSGMTYRQERLARCIDAAGAVPKLALKVVVFDDADYEFAREVHLSFPDIPFYLQVGTDLSQAEVWTEGVPFTPGLVDRQRSQILGGLVALSERVLADHWNNVRVLPQMHVLMHGDERRR